MLHDQLLAYAAAALAFVTGTAAMASYATSALLAHLDPAITENFLLAAQSGLLF
jgi:hypothetical protein